MWSVSRKTWLSKVDRVMTADSGKVFFGWEDGIQYQSKEMEHTLNTYTLTELRLLILFL